MIKKLKKLINQNEEIKNSLLECSDDFLLENETIILSALDTENIKKGYKIILYVNKEENLLEWTYVPKSKEAKQQQDIYNIKKYYKYKLPNDWEDYYLIDLNNITWTESKRKLAIQFKRIMKSIENNEKFSKGIWIYSKSNEGKTFASIALLNHITKHNQTVSLVNVSDFIAKTQENFNFNETQINYIEQVKTSDVIVIDDLGSERPTPWFKENVLLPIIDYRLKSNKMTIFTSNSNIAKYGNKLKYRSQNPEIEQDTNDKIISRINSLIETEVEIK